MKSNSLLSLLIFILLLLPAISLAQVSFKPLVGIPGVDPNADFGTYINVIYALSISIAGLLAVIKIMVAGVKYMLTDIVTNKEDAKRDINGALVGLLVVISAVLILNQINPQLSQSTVFRKTIDQAPGRASSASVTPAPLPSSGGSLITPECYAGATC
jgi:hypothetical protein